MKMLKLLRRIIPGRWHIVGHAPVDAGCMLIIDPCYLRDVLFEGNEAVEAWYDKAVIEPIDHAGEHWPITAPENNNRPVGTAVGHLISTGGDGYFPVEVRYGSDGRVTELRIKFSNE